MWQMILWKDLADEGSLRMYATSVLDLTCSGRRGIHYGLIPRMTQCHHLLMTLWNHHLPKSEELWRTMLVMTVRGATDAGNFLYLMHDWPSPEDECWPGEL